LDFGLLPQPLGELDREQLAEETADTDTGIEISFASDSVSFLFIISINRTIEGEFHKAGEGDHPLGFYLRS
jgi:hypothetical protein